MEFSVFQETKVIPKITDMKTETYQKFTRQTARTLKFRNERSGGTIRKNNIEVLFEENFPGLESWLSI